MWTFHPCRQRRAKHGDRGVVDAVAGAAAGTDSPRSIPTSENHIANYQKPSLSYPISRYPFGRSSLNSS